MPRTNAATRVVAADDININAFTRHLRGPYRAGPPSRRGGPCHAQADVERLDEPWLEMGHSPYDDRARFPPREPILNAALDTGLRLGRSGLWYSNDVAGSPTQGHLNDNREASLSLYEHDQSVFCHQCGIGAGLIS